MQINFGSVQPPPSRKLRNIDYQFVQMVDAAFDQADGFHRVLVDHVLAQHLNTQSNTAERILDLVSELRRGFTDRCERFGAAQRGLSFRCFSDIHKCEDLPVFVIDFQR